MIKVVNTPQADDIVERLEDLLARARAGEFSSIFLAGFYAGKTDWFTAELGVRLDRLRTIGVLESMKVDMLRSMDVEE